MRKEKKYLLLAFSFILLSFIIVKGVIYINGSRAALARAQNLYSVIIDAGHGGEDGGAQNKKLGIIESDLNLEIAFKTRDYLTLNGFNVIMTRSDEKSIHDGDASTIAARKRSDLKNRLGIIKNNPDAIFISIHLNAFPQERIKGAQVFYSPNNEESKVLGEIIQETLRSELDPTNYRLAKKGTDAIYLLHKAQSTAVLVEAGFLSNNEEAKLLSTDEYQNKIARAIYIGVMKYFEREIDDAE